MAAKSQVPPRKPVNLISVTAKSLDIKLDGYSCADVTEVWVVMDGNENEAFVALPRKADGTCHWTATPESFDTEESWFSLRLGIARTACAYSDGDRQESVGKLRFHCCRTEGRLVTITTEKRIPFSYTREVPSNSDGKQTSGCTELYSFLKPPFKIHSVWFPDEALDSNAPSDPRARAEILRLQLGQPKADPKAPGLIINDQSVTKYLVQGNETLSISNIREALRFQCSKGWMSMAPSFSADGYVAELEKNKGLKSIRITLVK